MSKKEENVVKVLRVGTSNNFNFTEAENKAIEDLKWDRDRVFVNSNSFVTITADYPSFITVNPYLDAFVEPTGDLSNIRACRIKYIQNAVPAANNAFVKALRWCASHSIPILITFMRFRRKAVMSRFLAGGPEGTYAFSKNYWRLTEEAKKHAAATIKALLKKEGVSEDLLHFCDFAGEGCPTCGNCAKLSGCAKEGERFELWGVSLKESGDAGKCMFHCPDCWAKPLADMGFLKYGKPTQNSKQRGYLAEKSEKPIDSDGK